MPTELKASQIIKCQGGLDVSQLVISENPGAGVILTNYEPGLDGGYRRISGVTKFNTNALSGTGSVLGVCVFNGGVLAFRLNDLYFGTLGSGAWSASIDTRAGSISKVRFERFNWSGTAKVAYVDGVNSASVYNGSTVTDLTTGPANAKYVAEFKRHLFFAGYSANNSEITWCSPEAETDFLAGNGAGAAVIGDEIVGLKSFREKLYIFCKGSIHVLTGSSLSDFAIAPVTKNMGCVAEDSIQEIGGDILFLAPDGLRTVAGTQKLDDVEIGSLTDPIQSIVANISNTFSNVCSTVVKRKSQYRLFYNGSAAESISSGVLGGLNYRQGNLSFEWSELYGIKPYICDNGYIGTTEYTVHGGTDGYVYYQDVGTNLNTATIRSQYRTPVIDFGNPHVRKVIHRVNIYYKTEGNTSFMLRLYYDRESPGVSQPPAYTVTVTGGGAVYGSGTYGTSLYSVVSVPIERRAVHGSGFLVQLDFLSEDDDPSITVEGFSFEYKELANR